MPLLSGMTGLLPLMPISFVVTAASKGVTFLISWRFMPLFQSASVLLVRDVLHPLNRLSVHRFLDGDVRHGHGGGSAVPMLLAGREPDDVPRPYLLDRPTLALHPAKA